MDNANVGEQPRKSGRPRKSWATSSPVPSLSSPQDVQTSPETDCNNRSHPMQLNIDELKLYHNFIMNSSQYFGYPKLWQEKVPQMAFKVPCILHLVIAFSALHMAIIRPEESRKFESIADAHYALGVPAVTQLMKTINKDNAPILFIASNLICISTFARRPAPGHLLLVAEGSEVPWLNLFRGVRFVIETMGAEAIFVPLGSMGACFQAGDYSHLKCDAKVVLWEAHFASLARLVSEAEPLEKETYRYELESLTSCFSAAFGTEETPKKMDGSHFKSVTSWLYNLQDDYIVRLQKKHRIALLLLAQFTVALRSIENGPFGRGWSRHILNEIKGLLHSQDISWLIWPIAQVQEWDDLRGDEHQIV